MRDFFGVIVGVFLIFLFNFSSLFAIELNISGEIYEYSSVYRESIELSISCNEQINLSIPSKSFEVFFNGEKSENNFFYIDDCVNLSKVSYKLDLVENLDSNHLRLERNFNNYNKINYSYVLKVPFEFSLDTVKSIPKKYEVEYGERGKYLIFNNSEIFLLYFEKHEFEEDEFSFGVLRSEVGEISVLFLMFVSFFLGAISVFFVMKKKLKQQPNQQVPSYVLSKEDRKVLDVVRENAGINQKQISNKLGFSKSRISAIVSDLEQKQLIRREKFGRSFKVYVNKKIV